MLQTWTCFTPEFLLPGRLRIKCRVCSAAGEEDPLCTYVHICTVAGCIKPTSLLLHGAGYSAWSLPVIISTLKTQVYQHRLNRFCHLEHLEPGELVQFVPDVTKPRWKTCTAKNSFSTVPPVWQKCCSLVLGFPSTAVRRECQRDWELNGSITAPPSLQPSTTSH